MPDRPDHLERLEGIILEHELYLTDGIKRITMKTPEALDDFSKSQPKLYAMKERRESGEDKREFDEFLKQGMVGVRPAEKTMTGVHQLKRNRQVYSVEGADAVIQSDHLG